MVTVRKRWPTEGKGKWKVWGLGSTEGIRYGKVRALRAYRAQGVRCALSLCVLWALLDRLRNSVSPTASTAKAGRCTPSGTWASRMAALSSTANRCTQLVQNDVEAMKNSAPAAAPNRPSHTRRTWRSSRHEHLRGRHKGRCHGCDRDHGTCTMKELSLRRQGRRSATQRFTSVSASLTF